MSRRTIFFGVAAVALVALVAGLGAVALLSREDGEQSPVDSETAAATSRFLAADGAPLVALGSLARPLLRSDEKGPVLTSDCESVVGPIYDQFKDVNFASLAVQVPDPVLARLMLAEQAAVFNGLSACGTGTMAEAGTQFRLAGRSADLVARRLHSIGR